MKAVLTNRSGSGHIKGAKKPAVKVESAGEKKQSFPKIGTAQGKHKKAELKNSNNSRKAKNTKEDKARDSKENKEKVDKEKDQTTEKKHSDKKIIPFELIAPQMNLKAVIAKISGKKTKGTGKKALSSPVQKATEKTGDKEAGKADQAGQKQKNENLKGILAEGKSNKATDIKLPGEAKKNPGKAKKSRPVTANRSPSKAKIVWLKTEAKNKSSLGKIISKDNTLSKQDSSAAHDPQKKQVVTNLKATGHPKQILSKLQLAEPVNPSIKLKEIKKQGGKAKNRLDKSTASKSGQMTGANRQQITVASQIKHNAASPRQKALFNAGLMTSKKPSDQSSLQNINMKMDTNKNGDVKDKSKKMSGNIHVSSLKAAHLTEASGRQIFSRQLARQVSHSQVNQQMPSPSKQATVWKHHHLMLKDGKAIHIASRASNGALQLELNAGNGQLGKLLQQHLQEIQQHVQQQLNININLQLKHFGGQQQGQSRKSMLKQPSENEPKIDENASVTGEDYTIDTHQARYFGFNRNEWTA